MLFKGARKSHKMCPKNSVMEIFPKIWTVREINRKWWNNSFANKNKKLPGSKERCHRSCRRKHKVICSRRKWLWIGAAMWKRGVHLVLYGGRQGHKYPKFSLFTLSAYRFLPLSRSEWSKKPNQSTPSIGLLSSIQTVMSSMTSFLRANRDCLAHRTRKSLFTKRKTKLD